MSPRALLRDGSNGACPTEQAQGLQRSGLQSARAVTLDSGLNFASNGYAQFLDPTSGKAHTPSGNSSRSAHTPRPLITGRQLQTALNPRAELHDACSGAFPTEQAQCLEQSGLQSARAVTLDSGLNFASNGYAQFLDPTSGKAHTPSGNSSRSAHTPRSLIKGRRPRKLQHLPAAPHERESANAGRALGCGHAEDELPHVVSEERHHSKLSSEELDEQFEQIISTMTLGVLPPRACDCEEEHHVENDDPTPGESLQALLHWQDDANRDRPKTQEVIRDLRSCMLKVRTSIESVETADGFEDDVQDESMHLERQ